MVTAPGWRSPISVPVFPILPAAGPARPCGVLVLDLLVLEYLLLAGALSIGLVGELRGEEECLGLLDEPVVFLLLAD